jgi:hypothetical protein
MIMRYEIRYPGSDGDGDGVRPEKPAVLDLEPLLTFASTTTEVEVRARVRGGG